MTRTRLCRLLQLASPMLPVGAYSYSQGLEGAIEAGLITARGDAQAWIDDALTLVIGRMEAPVLWKLISAWRVADTKLVLEWNALFLASRETSELRAETVQMGYSLARLLHELGDATPLQSLDEIAYPTAYAYAVADWQLEPGDALEGYLWSWLENQVMAAVKAIPLGQTDGQRMLLALGDRIGAITREAATLDEDDLVNFAPGLALLSSRHETQYSRLFRS